jgi:CBS domain-containing protein
LTERDDPSVRNLFVSGCGVRKLCRADVPRGGRKLSAPGTTFARARHQPGEVPMRVGELCSREVVVVEGQETVTQAARLMAEHHVGALIVVRRKGQACIPVGIVTDRDLTLRVLARERPRTQAVTEVMSSDLLSAAEDEEIERALKQMRSRGIRRVPVVNSKGELLGILSYDDIVEWAAEGMRDLAQLLAREQQGEQAAP